MPDFNQSLPDFVHLVDVRLIRAAVWLHKSCNQSVLALGSWELSSGERKSSVSRCSSWRDDRSQTTLRHRVCRVRLHQHSIAIIVHCYGRKRAPILRTRPVSDAFQRRSMANLRHWRCTSQSQGVHFRLLHQKSDGILRLTKVPPLLALLRHKRLRWVGHALRRAPTDRSRFNVLDQLNKPESRRTQLIQSDCDVANIPVDNLKHLAV